MEKPQNACVIRDGDMRKDSDSRAFLTILEVCGDREAMSELFRIYKKGTENLSEEELERKFLLWTSLERSVDEAKSSPSS